MRTGMIVAGAAFVLFCNVRGNAEQLGIGALFSLSGISAQGGREELNGALMAVDDICSADTGDVCPVSIIVEDNKSTAADTVRALSKLANSDRVSAVVGPNWSEYIDAAAPAAKTLRIPLVTATGFKADRLEEGPWVFVLWPRPETATSTLVNLMADRKIRRIAVAVNESAYFVPMLEAMKPQLSAAGIEITETGSFPPATDDFRSWIARVRMQRPDALVALLGEDGSFSSLLRQRMDVGFDIPVFAANTLPYDPIVKENLRLAEGLVYFDYIVAGVPEWKARYREKFGSEPGMGSSRAYDSVFLVFFAFSRCGNDRECIRSVLQKTDWNGTSGPIRFDSKGALIASAPHSRLFKVQNGKVLPLLRY